MDLNSFEDFIDNLLLEHNLIIHSSSIQDISDSFNIDLLFLYSPCRALKDNTLINQEIIILNKELDYISLRVAYFHELTHILLRHLDYCENLTNSELKELEKKNKRFSISFGYAPMRNP